MVTGLTTAAVQVAVTCVVGEAERWTDGSLTVQLELTCTAVFAAIHWGLPVERVEALKAALLAGAAAVWSTVADAGATLNVTVQLEEEVPPQPASPNNAAQSRTHANILRGNMVDSPFIVDLKEHFTLKLRYRPELPQTINSRLLSAIPARDLSGFFSSVSSVFIRGKVCLFSVTQCLRGRFTISSHENLWSLTPDFVSCGNNSRRLTDQLASRRVTAFGRGPNQGRTGCPGSHPCNV